MLRTLQTNLDNWKDAPRRKPLIVKGARQVGKTHVLESWGKSRFPRIHTLNFERAPTIGRAFEKDYDVIRIIGELSFHLDHPIDIKNDLLIFDEIQACPKALTSLKYFCEDMPELALVSAGSLLGVILSPESFPVGKVSFLHLRPMSFPEFVQAVDSKESWKYILKPAMDAEIPTVVHEHLWDLLRLYYVVGGMPEAIQVLAEERIHKGPRLKEALNQVRVIQRQILASYEQDFAKHAGGLNSVHIQALYRNIPSQLATVNDETTRRFQFGSVLSSKKGFSAWERPIHWLKNAGLIHQIKIANKSAFPLEHYTKPNMFKLMPHDIGLLGCMQNIPAEILLDQNYGIAKGYFAECYVAQALVCAAAADYDYPLYCWQEGESEIEFLWSGKTELVPIEVKSGLRTKSRSLGQYISRYHPSLSIRVSAKPLQFHAETKILNVPLALTHWIPKLI